VPPQDSESGYPSGNFPQTSHQPEAAPINSDAVMAATPIRRAAKVEQPAIHKHSAIRL